MVEALPRSGRRHKTGKGLLQSQRLGAEGTIGSRGHCKLGRHLSRVCSAQGQQKSIKRINSGAYWDAEQWDPDQRRVPGTAFSPCTAKPRCMRRVRGCRGRAQKPPPGVVAACPSPSRCQGTSGRCSIFTNWGPSLVRQCTTSACSRSRMSSEQTSRENGPRQRDATRGADREPGWQASL